MKFPRFRLRSAVGLFILAIVIGWALLLLANRFPVVDRLEDPNCFEIASAEKSIVKCTQSEPVSLCELVSNPDRYNYKIVRVQTIIVGYHHQHLYDPACNTEGTPTWVDYDSPEAAEKMGKAFAALKDERFDQGHIWAKVIIIGRFVERQPGDPPNLVEDPNFPQMHPIKDKFRFDLMSVEHAESVALGVPWPK